MAEVLNLEDSKSAGPELVFQMGFWGHMCWHFTFLYLALQKSEDVQNYYPLLHPSARLWTWFALLRKFIKLALQGNRWICVNPSDPTAQNPIYTHVINMRYYAKSVSLPLILLLYISLILYYWCYCVADSDLMSFLPPKLITQSNLKACSSWNWARAFEACQFAPLWRYRAFATWYGHLPLSVASKLCQSCRALDKELPSPKNCHSKAATKVDVSHRYGWIRFWLRLSVMPKNRHPGKMMSPWRNDVKVEANWFAQRKHEKHS